MKIYCTKVRKLSGTKWSEVNKKALILYKKIRSKTRRQPYIRSAYFKKEKIFLTLFWHHLHEKANLRDKTRRIKYFPCAIEFMEYSRFAPESRNHLNDPSQILHRFTGITPDKEIFRVQIKENKNNHKKWLISIFPYDK